MPLCAERLLNLASFIPGYGINKNHKTSDNTNMVINNNTFFNYVLHVFVSGTKADGYYDDLLPDEVMHFCGSGGESVLEEGSNELFTRIIAKKYNLRTNSCGYPKEVKLAYELMKCFGKEVIIKLAFIKSIDEKMEYLNNALGVDAANLYIEVSNLAEKEFNKKYYSHMEEYSGIVDIVKKMLFYRKIDYSTVLSLIQEYKFNHQEDNKKTI